jgi:hypothetical protein
LSFWPSDGAFSAAWPNKPLAFTRSLGTSREPLKARTPNSQRISLGATELKKKVTFLDQGERGLIEKVDVLSLLHLQSLGNKLFLLLVQHVNVLLSQVSGLHAGCSLEPALKVNGGFWVGHVLHQRLQLQIF